MSTDANERFRSLSSRCRDVLAGAHEGGPAIKRRGIRNGLRAAALLIATGSLLTGCAAIGSPVSPQHATDGASPTSTATPLSPRDAAALQQLDHAAATSARVSGDVTRVDCWAPSEHLLGGSAPVGVFSVLCRVHYDQGATQRYKDMTCIGDFFETPMLTRCYRWAYYSAEPRFEDGPRLASPPPSPFPLPTDPPRATP